MDQLFGAFYTARCAARAFIKLGIKGAIVFTASMASYRPNKVRQVISGINELFFHRSYFFFFVLAIFADRVVSAVG